MKLFALFGLFRPRGDLSAPGPHIIAGVIPGAIEVPAREELPPFDEAVAAMRSFCLPRAGNMFNLEYYRLHRGKPAVLPPRGTRVSPDAPPSSHSQPPACAPNGKRPAPIASPQSGSTPNLLVSTAQTSRSVSQPPRSLDSSGAAAPTNAEGA